MQREGTSLWVLRTLALIAIVTGVLSLFGVRPMNSRTTEVILGTAALVTGLVLLGITRTKSSGRPASIV